MNDRFNTSNTIHVRDLTLIFFSMHKLHFQRSNFHNSKNYSKAHSQWTRHASCLNGILYKDASWRVSVNSRYITIPFKKFLAWRVTRRDAPWRVQCEWTPKLSSKYDRIILTFANFMCLLCILFNVTMCYRYIWS
jgi:hypothetical protein